MVVKHANGTVFLRDLIYLPVHSIYQKPGDICSHRSIRLVKQFSHAIFYHLDSGEPERLCA